MRMKNNSQEHGAKYWKGLDDLAETPAFKDWVEKEFPSGASELEGVGRRNFMKIMAASFGLAGLGMTGCRRPKQHILPYAEQPENLIPGVANYYCTLAVLALLKAQALKSSAKSKASAVQLRQKSTNTSTETLIE